MMNVGFTFSELISTFRESLIEDSELEDFCVSNFDKPLRMFIGYVEKDGHGEDDCPFLMISPTSVDSGMAVSETIFTFEIDLAILNAQFNDYNENDIIEQKGFYLLDEMVNIVMNNLAKHAEGKNAVADMVAVSYDDSTFYPLHLANLICQVKLDTILGCHHGLT